MHNNNQIIENILSFWFGDIEKDKLPEEDYIKRWWVKDSDFDRVIKSRFEGYLNIAIDNNLDSLEKTPEGTLALIILLDQFSRNMYRDSPGSFSNDAKALRICLDGIEKGFDKGLHPVERLFFYMPLMHSEDIKIQQRSMDLLSDLESENIRNPEIAKMVSQSKHFSYKHYKIIDKFGRFPHRNKLLGRRSTPEETEFLKLPGSSF